MTKEVVEIFPGVYRIGNRIATRNLVPGQRVYKETLFEIDGVEYRTWEPHKSKLAAAIMLELKTFAFAKNSTVLYLGAASGTTVSHLSDIITDGMIVAVEFSPRPYRDMLPVAEKRPNIIPVLADARLPHRYRMFLGEVDVIYIDIAQADQAAILAKNVHAYLKKGGYAYFAIKARSIDPIKKAEKIYAEQLEYLEKEGLETVEQVDIDRYEKEHLMAVLKYR